MDKPLLFDDLAYPCIRFAYRMIGFKEDRPIWPLDRAFTPIDYTYERVKQNDILAWVRSETTTEGVLAMVGNVPVTTNVCDDVHVGVYIGNGLVADCTSQGPIPSIRVRMLINLTPPQTIYRWRPHE